MNTCISSVLDISEGIHEIADSDFLHELDVMLLLLQDVLTGDDDLSRAQALAVDAYGDASREMAAYLQSLHQSHVESQKRWFASVFTRPHEQMGVVRALLRRVQSRGVLVMRVLAIPQPPRHHKDDATPHPSSADPPSAEDLPIESTFIKLQKKYIQEMALKESLDEKRHKRRRTLSTFHSPSSKLP
ncbi:hypothetical protein DYB37_011406 [Aphanomyces astaci]|uniref:Uncharacterized protein n=1 Tax=Aphanomyces astaci TaxID=112090 RepID=A0A397C6F1_APHAT|nr:hypothetical protein DYB36_004936 [Aphanomyces astaci]RHY36882.1 hypothetical protein DYB25_010938 [Aphanomyces astaci]RHY45580.1 hypothetical protein DYB34_010849 [Aphanomyces astaci]RHY56357.1 hypothetical protein DYB30_007471 [Aphanomyces astaci]RHY86315.1 hypothetical protein DYB35_010493 [Aphanomyces astaci]